MTPRRQLVLMFVAPVVLVGAFGAVVAGVEGRWDIFFCYFLPTAVGGLAVIYGIAWVGLRWTTRKQYSAFVAVARELGGEVRRNLFGECQLRVPHERGTVAADLRITSGSRQAARAGGGRRWTRIALEAREGPLPTLTVELGADNADAASALTSEGTAVLAALRALSPEGLRLLLRGQAEPPAAEAWLSGWAERPERLSQLVREVPPLLERLARAERSR